MVEVYTDPIEPFNPTVYETSSSESDLMRKDSGLLH